VSWLAALCASLSPWGFLFSRIAWDTALAPCLFVWGLGLLLGESRRPRLSAGLGGILVALACYAYPPLRAQAALTVPFFVLFAHRRGRPTAAIASFAITLVAAIIPLARLTLSGELLGRFHMLSIFNERFLARFGGFSVPLVTLVFVRNVAVSFSPIYLLWSGDRNLRHSTGRRAVVPRDPGVAIAGDAPGAPTPGAIATKPVARPDCCRLRLRHRSGGPDLGVDPHASRSIGAIPSSRCSPVLPWPRRDMWPRLPAAILAVALAFAGWYFWDLFTRYPERSAAWFDAPLVERAHAVSRTGSAADYERALRSIEPGYPDLAILYFKLSSGHTTCRPGVEVRP
jgi:hypothetical protein